MSVSDPPRRGSPFVFARGPWLPLRNAALRGGMALLGGLVVLAGLGNLVLPRPNKQILDDALTPPGGQHLLGTDQVGRDVLSWVASGIITSVQVAVAVVVIAGIVGVVIGLIAGYRGGVLDAILMRIVDLQLAIPPLVFFIAASVVISRTMLSLILLLSTFAWVPYARVVRSRVLSERSKEHVAAARLAGVSRRRLLLVHLMPSSVGLIAVIASTQAGLLLLWESGLSFLGVGLQPPATSLGYLIFQGQQELQSAWWIATFPGIALACLIVAFNLIGNGLRDTFSAGEEI